jgi:hypothetical protein
MVIVTLSSKMPPFPMGALAEVDSALGNFGLRKQARSVLAPGKEFAVTYDGAVVDKVKISEAVASIADKHGLSYSVEIEESVSFP